ncbi:phage tail protein [Pseudomonas sp.]|uniref:phage tail protein n=1 Tax=Pseudomonas sp. TaxID=306 RepID=UPI001D47E6C7|nr:phage tail protein [Pseudomonas sp.]
MGPADQLDITGAKGGGSKPKTPVEAPDSLQSTNIGKILIAVGEGEFDGEPTDRDIHLDNTPIMDASGNVNFPGVKWEWRPGSVEQEYIQGIPAIENETTVNVELRSDNPFTRALSNTQLSAVRVRMAWPRLAQQDSSGNTNGYRIEYAIDIATDGGAYVEAHLGAVDGKTTNGYQRSVRVNLPKATSGWMLRVRRITSNANSGTIADTMTIAGYTEIIDQKLRYPNTALLYIEFDAQQFQNIPAVTVKCKAKRWPVPSNYDPVARTYSGVWDGTFKQAWTNNPAFVTYGVCVEDRFGLGKRIKPWMVDKWEMYRIAQYCDQRVPNGVGGQEPRFLCDMNLQGRAEAWTLLRDLSAIYRGMVYWAHGSLFMQADMPRAQDIDYVFTRANVIDGEFVYGGAERNTHYSRALVSYDNPANNYDTDVIPVTDNALQRRYRDRPIEISAIGCTRASEAQRRGKWALLSNSQDRTVTFKTGMEGRIPLPGYVIPVADELVAGRPNGGRISAAAGRVVTLDRDTPIKAGDRLILNLPNGTAQARTVQSVAGRAVTVTTAYGVQPEPELQWAIDYDDLAVQLFRVLKTTRTQEGEYEITALEFNPSKFAAIDTGAKLDERPISVIPVTTVQPPASVTLSSAHMIDQGIAVSTMTIAWPAVEGAVAYDVEWRKDNGNWVRLQRTGATSVDVVGIYAGAYLARVRAVSSFDITSIWKSSTLTQLNGKEGLPPSVTFLDTENLLFGIGIKWGFPAGAEDSQRTELWYSEGTDLGQATKLADLAYPQNEYVMQGLRAGQRFYFWARLVDRTGNLGPFFPIAPTVVSGMASDDAGPILEQIKDRITESELGKELTSRIDLIDMNGPGSVNERLGEVRSELNEQIVEVNNSVNQVQSDLQEQIDNIADLADSMPYKPDQAYTAGQSVLGENGKLYQAKVAVPTGNPPPNDNYWTDIGQAVQTANGMAARVQTVETKVQTLEGTTSAQSQQITGLQSSLTTTNGNVAAAQQAAQDAATLSGGKGKVIVQSAAPAVADRLAQNLWIDTTGNANTPKRWNGSAWVAVTDKVATDAAAAAQSALTQLAGKADATAVQSLTTRVTDAEGKLTSQGQSITGLQGSLTTTNQNVTAAQQAAQAAADAAGAKGKVLYQSTAPAVADRLNQNLWIDTTSNANTPKRWNGSAWVAVTDKVATDAAAAAQSALNQVAMKADASTVQALTNEVTRHGQDITAAGQAITSINTSLSQLGGENLLPNPSFEVEGNTPGLADGWRVGSALPTANRLLSIVPSTLDPRGRAQRVDAKGLSGSTYVDIALPNPGWVSMAPGQVLTVSAYVRGTQDLVSELYLQYKNSSGATIGTHGPLRTTLSDTWVRPVFSGAPAPAGTLGADLLLRVRGPLSGVVSDGYYEVDRAQAELSPVVSGWRDNAKNAENAALANASAITSVSGRVSRTEEGYTSVSGQLTQLDNSIGDIGGENLFYNPAFTKLGANTGNNPDGWLPEGTAIYTPSMVTSWLNSAEGAYRCSTPNVGTTASGNPYTSLVTAVEWSPSVAPGQTVTSSIYMRKSSDSGSLGLRIFHQWINAAGAVINAPATAVIPMTVDGDRISFTSVAPTGAVKVRVYYRAHAASGSAAAGTFDLARPQIEYAARPTGWRDNGQVNATENSATSAAVESLTSAVNQQGGTLSSVAGRTTSLENSLTTTNQNVTTAQQAAQAAASAAGAKGEVIYGATAPATQKRLAQNLWIDTTGNANTPKRWNGSAWVAVTDKVATDAATAAASALSQVATKAEASAVNSLTNRVNSAEGTLSSNSSDITQLKNSIGTAQPFVAGRAWEFLGSTHGWVGTIAGSTFTAGPLFATAGKCPNLQCNFTPAIVGAENPYLRIRLRRRNTTRTGAQMYWANEDGGLAEVRRMAWTISLTTNDWQDIEFDLSGHAGWNGKNITAIRLDMMNSVDSTGAIDIAYIAVGRRSAAASAQAVASLESNVTQQGGKLTAEGLRIDGLYTAVGNANAAIQNEAKARVDGDGALSKQLQTTQASLGTTNAAVQQVATAQADMKGMLNAQYTVRVQVNNQYGVHTFGGFGIGINEQNGVVQSAFVVNADQFVLLNTYGGGLSSPFSVVGGQTFVADAYIRNASIGTAKIADAAITSAKIGVAEVDTLRIRGNAVSVPVSASNPTNALGSGVGVWHNLIAVGVQMDEGGFITAQYSCYQGFGSGIRRYQFQMDINGLVIAEGGGDWADGFPSLMGSIGVGAGYFVITVKWWGENSGVGVKNHTLFAMGTKR